MKYYKTDSRRISFTEYWHIAGGMGFLIGWLFKILGIPLGFSKGIPEPAPFRSEIIEAEAVPKSILGKLNSEVFNLRQIGFDQFWFYTLKNSLTDFLAYGVQALHSSHKVLGKILYVSVKTRERLVLAFISELEDGTVLSATNKKRDFHTPPKYITHRQLGASAPQLWNLHQKKLSEVGGDNPPKTFADLDQVAAFEDEYTRYSFDDKIKRGIWVEMTDTEVADLRSKRLPPPIPS